MMVGIPPTTNSSSARRDRSIASRLVAAADDQLGEQRVERARHGVADAYPASTLTPGPDGVRHSVIVPGAGRNPRPASSALIRNSIA